MNWKKIIINIIMLLICSLLQFSVPWLRVYGAAPNWLFCVIVCVAVSESSAVISVIFALICGLIADFSSGVFFGHNAFWFIIISYITVFLIYKLFSRNFKTTLAVFTVGMILIKCFYYIIYSFGKDDFSFLSGLWSDLLPSYIISLPVLVFLYLIYSRFYYNNPDVKISGKVGFKR